MALHARHPGLVLAGIFFVMYQIAAMFEPLLDVVKYLHGAAVWFYYH